MRNLLTILLTLFVQSLFATTYYISNAGNDANNGTSQSTPFQTIDKVNTVTLVAGDQVLFRRGDTFYGTINMDKGFYYNAYGTGANPIIDGGTSFAATVFGAKEGLVIKNLDFKGLGNSGGNYYNSWFGDGANNHSTISNCRFYGGVVMRGSYNLFENNIVDGTTNNGDGMGVWEAFTNSHHNTYRGNTVSNFSVRGIWLMTKTSYDTVENNTIFNIGNCGIDLDGAFSVSYGHLIKGNTLHDIVNTSIELENGVNNIITENYLYNGGRAYLFAINYSTGEVQDGIGSTTPQNGFNSNNLFTNNIMIGGGATSPQGGVVNAIGIQSVSGLKYYNNTVYDFNGYHIGILGTATASQNIELVNNIMYNQTKSVTTLVYCDPSLGTNYLFAKDDYNLIYNPGNNGEYYTNSSFQRLSAYQTMYPGQAVHSISVNPQFVSTSDVHLQSSSPAMTAGDPSVTVQMGGYGFTSANIPPSANAGSDQTITANSVTLSGSGTDSDGSISSYLWSKVSGGTYSISNASVANPTITNLLQGTYIFRLTVTDNQGATATDDVSITVNISTGISNYFIKKVGGKTIYRNAK